MHPWNRPHNPSDYIDSDNPLPVSVRRTRQGLPDRQILTRRVHLARFEVLDRLHVFVKQGNFAEFSARLRELEFVSPIRR